MVDQSAHAELLALMSVRHGHFLLESGHHGDFWLNLDTLFVRATALRPFVVELATALAEHRPEVVCGPLDGGAFLAQLVASELDVDFGYAQRNPADRGVEYRIPEALREGLLGKRVAVVDDVINAGSAVRKTLLDLLDCGAQPIALGALLVLGVPARQLATDWAIPLERLESLSNQVWEAGHCPQCAAGQALEDLLT